MKKNHLHGAKHIDMRKRPTPHQRREWFRKANGFDTPSTERLGEDADREWTTLGSTWGIIDNKAYLAQTGTRFGVWEAPKPDAFELFPV